MAQATRYQILNFDVPQGLQDNIIDSLATLRPAKIEDERGRTTWCYDETAQIREYTDLLLKMDSAINELIGKEGLEVCPVEKPPRVVRNGNGPIDFHFVKSNRIAVLCPMTHSEVSVWFAAKGESLVAEDPVAGTKKDFFVALPETQYFVGAPHYVMVRPVRKV